MARAYGDALYGDCFYGGADVVPGGCVSSRVAVPCPDQQPDASGPADRLAGAVPCAEGDC